MSYPTRDWLTERGATELAQQIKVYWAAQGKKVKANVITARSPKTGGDIKAEMYCVRTDMINGLPRP